MSIFDKNLFGESKFEMAIKNLQYFEPSEGYYLAFSGGKDSVVIEKLAELSGVKYDSHYALTNVDPPELVSFIKKHYPKVNIIYPKRSMWELIRVKLMPPTRRVRYCCSEQKEEGGNGRFVITGVRWVESKKRKKNRDRIEFDAYGSKSKQAIKNRSSFKLMNDNSEKRKLIDMCVVKGKNILNPIIDWEDDEVWEFIKYFSVNYCELYDEGFERLGCIGCPLATIEHIEKEFKRWPIYKLNYIKAFERMLIERERKGKPTIWKTGEEVFEWWLYGITATKKVEGQIELEMNELQEDEEFE